MITVALESADYTLIQSVFGLQSETFVRALDVFKKNFLSSFILDGTVALPFLFGVLFVSGLNVLLLDPSPDYSLRSFISEVESLYRCGW